MIGVYQDSLLTSDTGLCDQQQYGSLVKYGVRVFHVMHQGAGSLGALCSDRSLKPGQSVH